jgi:hypothetical protein
MVSIRFAEFKNSSNIKSAQLHEDGVCFVSFSNGQTYGYSHFTEQMFDDWQAAKSPGGWFHANVRAKPDAHPVVMRDVPAPSQRPPGVPPTIAPPLGQTIKIDEERCSEVVKEGAQAMYIAYTNNSDNLNYQGLPCPSWDKLTSAVRSHWCAAAIEAQHGHDLTLKKIDKLERELAEARQLIRLGQTEATEMRLALKQAKDAARDAAKAPAPAIRDRPHADALPPKKSTDFRPWRRHK